MIRSESAIVRLRRDLMVSSVLKAVLLAGALVAVLLETVRPQYVSGGLLLVVVVSWLALHYRSVKSWRHAAQSPMLIASGEYEQAEEQIEQSLRGFSLFRTVKLRALHYLAMLRHAQRRWADAALLCQALLQERLGGAGSLAKTARLMLADSLLEVGDLPGAYQSIAGLYDYRLSLGEALELTCVQQDYLSRIGAWDFMVQGMRHKVQLAELMPSARAAQRRRCWPWRRGR